MALSGLRWLALTVAACAIVWLGVLFRAAGGSAQPSDDVVQRSWIYSGSPAAAVEGRVAQVNDRLRTLELRDSVLGVARRSNESSLTILVDPRLAPASRQNFTAALEREWTALQIPAGTHTIVALVMDTTRFPHGLPRTRGFTGGLPIDAFLPSAETGGACVELATLHSWPTRSNFAAISARLLASTETVRALLSPCAFYAAFGAPSPSIAHWLTGLRWTPARLAEWNEASPPWRPALAERVYNPMAPARNVDPTERLRWLVAPSGLSCIAGEAGACEHILFEPRRIAVDSVWRAHVVPASATDITDFYFMPRASTLGPADGSILSEMVRTLGRDRFKQFWLSPLSPLDAFKQASGEDADEWTHAWAKRMYGPIDVQPRLSAAGMTAGLMFIAVALAGAALIGDRRRVA